MIAEEYLGRSRLFPALEERTRRTAGRGLCGAYRQRRARWSRHLAVPQLGRRSPELDRSHPLQLTDLDERMVERYLRTEAVSSPSSRATGRR